MTDNNTNTDSSQNNQSQQTQQVQQPQTAPREPLVIPTVPSTQRETFERSLNTDIGTKK